MGQQVAQLHDDDGLSFFSEDRKELETGKSM